MEKQRKKFIIPMAVMIAILAFMAFSKPRSAYVSAGGGRIMFEAPKARTDPKIAVPADPFLNKQLADALCTLIVLGYAKDLRNCTFQFDGNAKDQEKAALERKDYDVVQRLFKALGVDIIVSSSKAQEDFPLIIAKTDRFKSIDTAKAALSADYIRYLTQINNNANAKGTAPKGAYIGGISTISTLFIAGPSKLDQYKPSYRVADDNLVQPSFESAKVSINNAIKALTAVAKPSKSAISYADLNPLETASFSRGCVYKCYHGMIRAMVNYHTTIDKNSFIFEIALGENTTKVSSCFACSAYMAANGKPATSTHLGRGDNWNIPDGDDAAYKTWAKKIADWYKLGKGVFSRRDPKESPDVTNLFAELGKNNRERDIHKIFLEALTFEGSFTDRIKTTLKYIKI
jgi:hypothetical protein